MKNKILQKYKAKSKNEKKIINSVVSLCVSGVWAIIQFVLFLISGSVFLLMSSLFSISLCLAILFCVLGFGKDENDTIKKYLVLSSVFIIAGGIFYETYSIRLLFGETPTDYGLIISITIALFSFIFLITSIVTLIRDRKNQNKYVRNLKIIAFVSSLVDIMLTQMSLLMANSPEMDQRYNLYFALVIGGITILLGLYALIRPFIHGRNNKYSEFIK